MVALGYLKINRKTEEGIYQLSLTNKEVCDAFSKNIKQWFEGCSGNAYGEFLGALIRADVDTLNETLNDILTQTISNFDPSGKDPEKFYHGFVLGLLVSLRDKYIVTSNGESGYGRYDVILEPRHNASVVPVIMEFKSVKSKAKDALLLGASDALEQIKNRHYATDLVKRGWSAADIVCLGFAFRGKKVLIVSDSHR